MQHRVALLAVLVALVPTGVHADDTTEYTVKAGDTCLGIAIGVLGDRKELAAIHKLNPQLGATPHELVAGSVLKLPAKRRRADARVARTHKTVEVRKANDDTWTKATVGNELFKAWRVGAREQASARLEFADTSAIELRENTVVVIYGATAAASAPAKATLETGGLRTRLGELDGKVVEIETPSSVVDVGPGSSVVEVDTTGTTRVSNHAGKSARLRGRVGGSTTIDAGYGADAPKGKRPSKARPLPPAPVWAQVPALAVGWRDTGAALRASWNAAPGAAQYRLELVPDRGSGDEPAIIQLVVPSNITAVDLRGIPGGVYQLGISSIDATGLEGAAARSRTIRGATLAVAGSAVPAGDPDVVAGPADDAPRTLAVGDLLEVPAGVTCTIAGRTVATAGTSTVACHAGTASADLAITTPPVAVALASSGSGGVSEGQVATIDLAITGPLSPTAKLVATSDDHVRVVSVTRTATGASVTLAGRTAGQARVQLALITSAGEVAIGTTTIDVEAVARLDEAPSVVTTARAPRIWVSAFGGVTARDGADPVGGASIEVGLARRIAVDAGAAFGGGGRDTVDAGVIGKLDLHPVTPMLRLGAIVDLSGDVGGRVGLATRIDIGSRVAAYLRFDTLVFQDDLAFDAVAGVAFHLD